MWRSRRVYKAVTGRNHVGQQAPVACGSRGLTVSSPSFVDEWPLQLGVNQRLVTERLHACWLLGLDALVLY